MNSLKIKQLKIDSSKASSYYNSYKTSFTYSLSESITVGSGESIVYSLISCTIPYTFYGLNKYNNILDIQETIGTIVQPIKSLNIPDGNYDAYSFAKMILSLINTNPNIQYSIIYNKINNKFIIYTTKPNTSALLLFSTGPNNKASCHAFLGCPNDADVLINNEHFETGMITMNDIYHLQIKSDLGSQNVITSDSIDNILEIIPITPSPLSFIHYSPFIQSKYLLNQNNLQSIRFELTDNQNRPLDLNGIPFILNIKIEVIKNLDYEIPTGVDPRRVSLDNDPLTQTPLERIIENVGIIDRPSSTPVNLRDLMEYNIIQTMIAELYKKKHKK